MNRKRQPKIRMEMNVPKLTTVGEASIFAIEYGLMTKTRDSKLRSILQKKYKVRLVYDLL